MCITSGPDAPINPEWLTRTGEMILSLEGGGDSHQYIRRLSPNEVQLVKANLTWEDNDTYYCRAGPLRRAVALIVQGEVKGYVYLDQLVTKIIGPPKKHNL